MLSWVDCDGIDSFVAVRCAVYTEAHSCRVRGKRREIRGIVNSTIMEEIGRIREGAVGTEVVAFTGYARRGLVSIDGIASNTCPVLAEFDREQSATLFGVIWHDLN